MCLARVRRSPPTTRKDFRKRNETIRAAFAAGVSLAELAEHYGISDQRVSQIVNFRNH